MPFSDFQFGNYFGYKPSLENGYSKNECKNIWEWSPLLESNGAGYFTRQEHVTPFAGKCKCFNSLLDHVKSTFSLNHFNTGFTGRLYGLTVDEYESFSVPPPSYNYCEEVDFVLSETLDMANDDKKKVEIEVYDSKFTSLLPMQIEWSIKNQFSSFDFWYYDMALVTSMYDATMLVWREKVIHNAVRPTTVVHELKGDEDLNTYAGPFEESANVKGFDWQPYIRTMPVREYQNKRISTLNTMHYLKHVSHKE